MGKMLGYGLMTLGIVVIALPIFFQNFASKLPFQPFWIIILGLIIMGFGFVMLKPGKSKPKQIEEEVPIYHGNKIVGYRKDTR